MPAQRWSHNSAFVCPVQWRCKLFSPSIRVTVRFSNWLWFFIFSWVVGVWPNSFIFLIVSFSTFKASIFSPFFHFMFSSSLFISNIIVIGFVDGISSFCLSFPIMLRVATMWFLNKFFFRSHSGCQNVLTMWDRISLIEFASSSLRLQLSSL